MPESSALGAGPAAAVQWPSRPWLVPVLTTELGGVLVFWENSPSWRIFSFSHCRFFLVLLRFYHQFVPSVLSFRNSVVQVSCHTSFAFPSAGDLFFLFYFFCYFRDNFGGKIKYKDKSATLNQKIALGLFTYEKIKIQRMKRKKKYRQKLA